MKTKESLKEVAKSGGVKPSTVNWIWRLLPRDIKKWLKAPGVTKRTASMIATILVLGGISGYSLFLNDNDRDFLSGNEEPWCDNNTWDSDGDGISDGDEMFHWGTDPCKLDTDDDGLWDGQEIYYYFTNASRNDTDGDGLTDFEDPRPLNGSSDIDGDGVLDQYDINWSKNVVVKIEVKLYNNYSHEMNYMILYNGSAFFSYLVNANGSTSYYDTIDFPDNISGIYNISVSLTYRHVSYGFFTASTKYLESYSFSNTTANGTVAAEFFMRDV